jgi:hypothetical protein
LTDRPSPPELSVVAERVAHDVRGFTGLLVSALHELTRLHESSSSTDDAEPHGLTTPELLRTAGRVTFRLERIAARLDAVAHQDRFPPALVDLEPLIKDAVALAVRSERRADVSVTLPGVVTRVCVVPQASVEAIEDLLAWALKRSSGSGSGSVSLTVDVSSSTVARIRVTAMNVTAAPAMSVPFQDPLGMANWLLLHMGGALHAEVSAHEVTLVASLPRGPAVGG